MSYDTEREKAFRRPIVAVELELDTGSITFSDIAVQGYDSVPILSKYTLAPTTLAPAQGLGQRGQVKLVLDDYEEDGLPGSYLGRLIADNPYYLDRKLIVKIGYVTDNFNPATDLSERHYFIESIDGPSESGKVTITGRDALKPLYIEKAKAPGSAKTQLNQNISASKTGNVSFIDTTDFPASGYIVMGEEYIFYSAKATGNRLVFATRGAFGTTAAAYDSGEEAAEILAYNGVNCVDAIRDLILDYTDIDPALINNVEWNNERDNFLGSELLFGPAAISPTPVKDIISKIAMQCYLNIWWDERDQEIKLRANGPTLAPVDTYTDDQILDQKAGIKRSLKDRVTQVWYYYEKIDKSGGDNASNYRNLEITADLSLETPAKYGSSSVKVIFANLIDSAATAIKVGSRILDLKQDGTTKISFKLDAKDIDFWTGDFIRLDTDLLQTSFGNNQTFEAQVTQVLEQDGHTYTIEAVATDFDAVSRYGLIGPDTLLDYPAESPANIAKYAFISQNTAPYFADLTDAYRIL